MSKRATVCGSTAAIDNVFYQYLIGDSIYANFGIWRIGTMPIGSKQ
jgi:hypothetical protein